LAILGPRIETNSFQLWTYKILLNRLLSSLIP